ncbi:MAG: KilA-N domain-containing protein [Methylobacter sp.]|nr:KilA-N domain-containing protein [Methylobacter sp.]
MNLSPKLKYEIVSISNIEVMADVSMLQGANELFFNATLIASQFDKLPKDWLRTEQAKEYIRIISQKENKPFENLTRITKGGKFPGTWLHHRLTLVFARWLNTEFEYDLDRWIESRVEDELRRKQHRLELKTGFLPLTNAIQAAHIDLKPYHFSNECDLINRLVTGMSAKKFKQVRGVESVRDALTAAESQLMDKLQRQDTSLIELGFSYEERKRLLIKYADKPLGAI